MSRLRRRVVITGLGVVAPNGIGKTSFWRSLMHGESAIRAITSFDTAEFPCRIAGEIPDFHVKDFITPARAKNMARFSQFAVAATRLAIEDSRITLSSTLASEIFISFGTSVSGFGTITEGPLEHFRQKGVAAVEPWAALEYPPHAAASHIAIELGIKGPAVSLSSNCCTGLDVIHRAYIEIAAGRTAVAIAGSCDAPLFPAPFAAFCALRTLSRRNNAPEKASRPYDRLRDGIVLSEGGASVILEYLAHAEARGAHIYESVLGFGGASEAIGMRKGDVSGLLMAKAIRDAISDADIV